MEMRREGRTFNVGPAVRNSQCKSVAVSLILRVQ